jgi:demethylmenaquinone methyltransferase/2-methoxy-6-polyprenyl-1,4-benzoquinol methylase
MTLGKHDLRNLYRKRVGRYDFVVWLYRLIGLWEAKYRQATVDALLLKPGDTVVDLACGTGLNFAYLEKVVQETGRIIGVDLTDAMLDQAHRRVQAAGWQNVDLVQADLARYTFLSEVEGILSTFAISLVPEYDQVIQRGADALRDGG